MQRIINTSGELKSLVGQEIAVSDWLVVDQERIDLFARATGDHQWIHVDVERAKRESPYGCTIAHGMLTVSLSAEFYQQAVKLPWSTRGVYYGFNKIRFPAPAPVNSRLRGRFKVGAVSDIENGVQINWQVTVEREGGDKPVCIVETVSLQFW